MEGLQYLLYFITKPISIFYLRAAIEGSIYVPLDLSAHLLLDHALHPVLLQRNVQIVSDSKLVVEDNGPDLQTLFMGDELLQIGKGPLLKF